MLLEGGSSEEENREWRKSVCTVLVVLLLTCWPTSSFVTSEEAGATHAPTRERLASTAIVRRAELTASHAPTHSSVSLCHETHNSHIPKLVLLGVLVPHDDLTKIEPYANR